MAGHPMYGQASGPGGIFFLQILQFTAAINKVCAAAFGLFSLTNRK